MRKETDDERASTSVERRVLPVRDLIALCNSLSKAERKRLFEVIHEELGKEIEKGADLNRYFDLKFNVKTKSYVILLNLPCDLKIFDSVTSNANLRKESNTSG